MSERRFKDQITDALSETLPDATGGVLEKWLAPTTESKIEQIPVEQIRDRAWRADVDTTEPAYRALKASIRASGVLQPLLLRPHPEGGFEVVSGARRFRAARDTAQSTIPAVVRELDDVQALVGGSWDAVLRLGLTPTESQDLVGKLMHAGMEKTQATALVATVPVRDEPPVVAPVETPAPVDHDVIVAADDVLTAAAFTEPLANAEDDAALAAPTQETVAASGEFAVELPDVAAESADVVADVSAESAQAVPADVVAEPDAVATPELDAIVDEAAVAEPVVEPTPADSTDVDVDEPAVLGELAAESTPVDAAEPPIEAPTLTEPEPDTSLTTLADFDFDEDVSGWPAPDQPPSDTAPTQPPIPLPLDPTPFPIGPAGADNGASEPLLAPAATAVAEPPRGDAGGNGAAPAPAVEATVAVAAVGESETPAQAEGAPAVTDAVVADPAAPAPVADSAAAIAEPVAPIADSTPAAADSAAAVAEPAAPTPAPEVIITDEPAAVTAPDEASTPVGAAPHVIPINLPEAPSVVIAEEESDLAGSMPVAAPAAEAEAEPGSRLVASPAPPDAEARPITARPAAGVPALLRRGPLFYAVLGIGLAVGAIVFILVSVSEGVGGTTSIIGAVVVAVVGFVTAMISLAQPRQRR